MGDREVKEKASTSGSVTHPDEVPDEGTSCTASSQLQVNSSTLSEHFPLVRAKTVKAEPSPSYSSQNLTQSDPVSPGSALTGTISYPNRVPRPLVHRSTTREPWLERLSRLPPALPWGSGSKPSRRPRQGSGLPSSSIVSRPPEGGPETAGAPSGYQRLPTGACRVHERLKPVLRWNFTCYGPNGRLADLGQHFKASEVMSLLRCLLAPLLSLRVGRVVREGRKLCPTRSRGTLVVMVLPTSDLRFFFIGDGRTLDQIAELNPYSENNQSAKLEVLAADPSGRTFSILLPSGKRAYFWNSEKVKTKGDDLVNKLKALLDRPPTLSELTGIPEFKLEAFALMLQTAIANQPSQPPPPLPTLSANPLLPPNMRPSQRLLGWASTSGSRTFRGAEPGELMRTTSRDSLEGSALRRGFYGGRRESPLGDSFPPNPSPHRRESRQSQTPPSRLVQSEVRESRSLAREEETLETPTLSESLPAETSVERRPRLGASPEPTRPHIPKVVTSSNIGNLLNQAPPPPHLPHPPHPMPELVPPTPLARNLDPPKRPTAVTTANLEDVVRRHVKPSSPRLSPHRTLSVNAEVMDLEPPSPACVAGGGRSPKCRERKGDHQ